MLSPHHLRALRLSRNLTESQLASALNITLPHYYDLEGYPDELSSTLSLAQLESLASQLQVSLTMLLGTGRPLPGQTFAFDSLATALQIHLACTQTPIETFEDQIGWSVGSILQSPTFARDWNFDCLQALTTTLGQDWQSFIQ